MRLKDLLWKLPKTGINQDKTRDRVSGLDLDGAMDRDMDKDWGTDQDGGTEQDRGTEQDQGADQDRGTDLNTDQSSREWWSNAYRAQSLARAIANADSAERTKAELDFARHAQKMNMPPSRLKSFFPERTDPEMQRLQLERAVAAQRLYRRDSFIETGLPELDWPQCEDVPEPCGEAVGRLFHSTYKPNVSAEASAERFFDWMMQQRSLLGRTWFAADLKHLYFRWSSHIGWWPHDWARIAKYLGRWSTKGSCRLDGCRLRTYSLPHEPRMRR